ncbi:hypothetical protein AB0K12_11735 [Nonomuraea sp. NPDC049419]|uniref:hypothetical protein n=1 Tax=Nonomuraea sp. NPDC049419 TaxID=3155772 RepID=UPI003436245E
MRGTPDMDADAVAVVADSVREMGRDLADTPMRDLEEMTRAVARVRLSSGAYGAFGMLGGALGRSFDEVNEAAQRYLLAKRDQVAELHDRAYDTANGYVDGNAASASVAATMAASR